MAIDVHFIFVWRTLKARWGNPYITHSLSLLPSFTRPDILEELVDYVLQQPDDSKDESVRYK